ncbi:MAG: hypothetical protein LBT22_02010 [Peptococcaceae bacterium]|jgi:hypothetical protein|nr:hypothetical protein [Peptococcaceae bacterium]
MAITVFLLGFAVFGIVKLTKKSSKYKGSKKTFAVFIVIAGVVSVVIIGVFSAFVIRFYSLSVVSVEDAYRNTIRLNGTAYTLSDTDDPFSTALKPIARENLPDTVFTPEWAIDLVFSASYYYSDGKNTDLIYYTGMMDWLVYEKAKPATQ